MTKVRLLSEKLGITPAQLAIQWVVQNEDVASVLVGVRSIVELEENLRALENKLEPEYSAALENYFPSHVMEPLIPPGFLYSPHL